VRIAVLAALNIADECFQAKAGAGDGALRERAARIAETLDQLLAGPQ
jgi:hypothetical protein